MMKRIAILQMCSGIDPQGNARDLIEAIAQSARAGAQILFTPEMSGLIDRNRKRAAAHIVAESENNVLAQVQRACRDNGIWCALGSLAVQYENGEGGEGGERGGRDEGREERWANRSFLIDSDGRITARYDKAHMFDVDLDTGENWRESAVYRPGNNVISAPTPLGQMGLTICYDIRFPNLFDILGRVPCDVIAIPAAFTVPTGRDHWEVLLRARAIEASAFIVAAAQTGQHADGRETYGHSMVVDPWGRVLLNMGQESGLGFVDLDFDLIDRARKQIPSLANRRDLDRGADNGSS